MVEGVISLLAPSRGRPTQCLDMIETALDLADRADDVEIIVRYDHDDPERRGYEWLTSVAVPIGGPRNPYSGLWDEAATVATGAILGIVGDDFRFRTPGWDSLIRDAHAEWPDGIGLVYGRDGVNDERMATHAFITARWRQVTGHICPNLFDGDYIDLWVHTVAQGLGRLRFRPDLVTEHLHPCVDKAPVDATYQEKFDRMKAQRTHEVWDASEPLRLLDEQRLAAAINEARAGGRDVI